MTVHTFVSTRITSVVKPVHIFMARSTVPKNLLKAFILFYSYCFNINLFWGDFYGNIFLAYLFGCGTCLDVWFCNVLRFLLFC